jgi:hypothetical protein
MKFMLDFLIYVANNETMKGQLDLPIVCQQKDLQVTAEI